ncbi:MAG: hypothetical protein LBV58_03845 [Acholeplasmatales bacterium]|jgi:hypothetical protein|nr:hypothetical protein [Acholeplasmatales bacterium]
MKKTIILLLLIFSAFVSYSCVNIDEPIIDDSENIKLLTGTDLTSEYIIWNGRHLFKDDRQYFYNTATGFIICFDGREVIISLILENSNQDIYFSIFKDKEVLLDSNVFSISDSEDILISFDEPGIHYIELVKRSEPQDGETSLKSIETNGTFKKIEKEEKPHFLLLGASGISGHGALGLPNTPRSTANSSSLHSFGYLTAKNFNGTVEFVSNSGWGVAFGFNNQSTTNNILNAYDYYGISSSEKLIGENYEHNNYIPDVIIVNAGGNDYSAVINKLTGFEKQNKIDEFKAAVFSLLMKLRTDAPDALIIWTMTSGSLNGNAALSVINQLEQVDKAHIHMIVIKDVGEGAPAGANGHCSYLTHQLSAEVLSDAIEQFSKLKRVVN